MEYERWWCTSNTCEELHNLWWSMMTLFLFQSRKHYRNQLVKINLFDAGLANPGESHPGPILHLFQNGWEAKKELHGNASMRMQAVTEIVCRTQTIRLRPNQTAMILFWQKIIHPVNRFSWSFDIPCQLINAIVESYFNIITRVQGAKNFFEIYSNQPFLAHRNSLLPWHARSSWQSYLVRVIVKVKVFELCNGCPITVCTKVWNRCHTSELAFESLHYHNLVCLPFRYHLFKILHISLFDITVEVPFQQPPKCWSLDSIRVGVKIKVMTPHLT